MQDGCFVLDGNPANGAVTTNAYDIADRLTGITTVKTPSTLQSITYTLDNVGNRLTMVEPSDLSRCTMAELRKLRDELQDVELGLSYARRFVQGRMKQLDPLQGPQPVVGAGIHVDDLQPLLDEFDGRSNWTGHR